MWVQSLGWEGHLENEIGNPLQYSCLGSPVDRGAWWATVHGDAKSQTQLNVCGHTHTHTDTQKHTLTLPLSLSLKERGLHKDVDSWTGGHWKPL